MVFRTKHFTKRIILRLLLVESRLYDSQTIFLAVVGLLLFAQDQGLQRGVELVLLVLGFNFSLLTQILLLHHLSIVETALVVLLHNMMLVHSVFVVFLDDPGGNVVLKFVDDFTQDPLLRMLYSQTALDFELVFEALVSHHGVLVV